MKPPAERQKQCTAVLVAAVLGTGCASDAITDSAEVEVNLHSYMEEQLGRPIDDVDCPGSRDLVDGDEIDCHVVFDDRAVEITVTVSGSQGNVTYYPDLAQ